MMKPTHYGADDADKNVHHGSIAGALHDPAGESTIDR
jgi:hypothetical protein